MKRRRLWDRRLIRGERKGTRKIPSRVPILLLDLLFPCVLLSSDFVWPTDASRALSSSFGEYRPGHFHAGLDIKTWGRTGYRVFAVSSGYVWKVRVSPFGYGKVVYQVLDDGGIAVYAHLSRFCGRIEELVKAKQRRLQRYSVTLEFRKGDIPVRRGEVIAYTGDTGVGYPHLHFEVRDAHNRPVNPMLKGFTVRDDVAPRISSVAVVPLASWSRVNGDVAPKVFTVSATGGGWYEIGEAVRIWGPVYIAVCASDGTSDVRNRIAPYELRLYVDGQLVFASRYDRFSYDQTNLIVLDRDIRLKERTGDIFYRLFVDPENHLPFYGDFGPGAGVLWGGPRVHPGKIRDGRRWLDRLTQATVLNPGVHRLRIVVTDFQRNACELKFSLEVTTSTMENVVANGRQHLTFSLIHEKPSLNVEWYEDFARIELEVGGYELPDLFVQHGSGRERLRLEPLALGRCVAVWPFPDADEVRGRFIAKCGAQVLERPFVLHRIGPNKAELQLRDHHVKLLVPTNAAYRPFFAEMLSDSLAEVGAAPLPTGPVVKIAPSDVPLRKAARLVWRVSSDLGVSPRKLAWYYFGGDNWTFVGNELDPARGRLEANIPGFGVFGVLADTVAPQLAVLQPQGSKGKTGPQTPVVISLWDELSGIASEDDFELRIDGKRVVAEWDPEERLIRYVPDPPFSPGEHELRVWARDRSGNTAQQELRFTVQ